MQQRSVNSQWSAEESASADPANDRWALIRTGTILDKALEVTGLRSIALYVLEGPNMKALACRGEVAEFPSVIENIISVGNQIDREASPNLFLSIIRRGEENVGALAVPVGAGITEESRKLLEAICILAGRELIEAFVAPAALPEDKHVHSGHRYEFLKRLLGIHGTMAQLEYVVNSLLIDLSLHSVSLFTVDEAGARAVCAAGVFDNVDISNEIRDVAEGGKESRHVIYSNNKRGWRVLSLLPVNSPSSDTFVAAVEMRQGNELSGTEAEVKDRLETALSIMDYRREISHQWMNSIKLMISAAEAAPKNAMATYALLEYILNELKKSGEISSFTIEEIKAEGSLWNGDGDSDKGGVIPFQRFSSGSRNQLEFTVSGPAGKHYFVRIMLRYEARIQSARDIWIEMANLFNILSRYLLSDVNIASLEMEGRQRFESLALLNDALSDAKEGETAESVIVGFSSALSSLFPDAVVSFMLNGNDFRQLFPEMEERSISEAEMSSMLFAATPLGKDLLEIQGEEALPAQFTHAGNRRNFAIVLREGKKQIRGVVIFSSHSSPFGHMLSMSIENAATAVSARLALISSHSELRRVHSVMERIKRVINDVSSIENESTVLRNVVETAANITHSQLAAISVVDIERMIDLGGETVGFRRFYRQGQRRDLNGGIIGKIMRTMQTCLTNKYQMENDRLPDSANLQIRTMAGAPIYIDVKRRGYIIVMNTQEGAYRKEHTDNLEMLASLVSNAYRAMDARRERKKMRLEFAELQKIEADLYSAESYGLFLKRLADALLTAVHASHVLLASAINGVKRVIISSNDSIPAGSVIYNSGPLGMQFEDAALETRHVEKPVFEEEWGIELDVNDMLLVKIGKGQDTIVAAVMDRKDGLKFDGEDVDRFSSVSLMASTAYEKQRLVEGLKRRLKHLEIMHSLIDGMARRREDIEILASVLPSIVEMCDADLGLIWRYNESTGTVRVEAEHYVHEQNEHLLGYVFKADRGYTGTVVRGRKPVLVANAAIEKGVVHIEGTKMEDFESVLGVPLMIGETLIGVLMIYRTRPPSFGAMELEMLSSLSHDISLSMMKSV